MKLKPFYKYVGVTGVVATLVILFSIKIYSINIHSTKFATPEGLADNTVREIFQDSKGYLWFGTFDGLSRYDGYSIEKISPTNPIIPLDSHIRHIYEDKDGYLWIMGSSGIVSCYDLNRNEFIDILPDNTDPLHYFYYLEAPNGDIWLYGEDGIILAEKEETGFDAKRIYSPQIESDNVNRVMIDSEGRAFISTDRGMWTYNNGEIYPLDKSRSYQWVLPGENATLLVSSVGEIIKTDGKSLEPIGQIENIKDHSDLPAAFESRGHWYVTTSNGGGVKIDSKTLAIEPIAPDRNLAKGQIITDTAGDIWLHNNSGFIYFYDSEKDRLVPLRLFPENMLSLLDMERYSIARDNFQRAWIATGGNGLYLFDPADYSLEHYTARGGNYEILPTDRLLVAMADNHGNIWVGAEHGGAAMLAFDSPAASHLNIPISSNGNPGVRSITKLPNGNIAVASFDGNLYEYSSDLHPVKTLSRDAVVYDIAVDPAGNVWEATRGKGVLLNGKAFDSRLPELSFNDVFAVEADKRGRIWVGTFGAGLDVLLPKEDGSGYEKRNYLNSNYAERRIRDIFEDSKGNLWVATNNGAYKFNPDALLEGKEQPQLFNSENGKLRSNEVPAILEDNQGRIWIAEAENGITVIDFKNGEEEIFHLGTENGLSHNNVQSLVLDGDYVWAATRYGISRINAETHDIESFVVMPVPSENIHNSGSALLLDDGRLLLGTNQGAYIVNPSILTGPTNINPITVTNFRIEGESYPFIPGSNDIKEKDGEYFVKVPYNKNSLEFSFSTFDFSMPKQTKFRYKLEPVDVEWNDLEGTNTLAFRNLASGKYKLIVEASQNSGNWDKQFICNIDVKSPWWSTWWARVIYIVLILCGVYLLARIFERFTELHNKIKVEEQLTDYKLEFFTNISHEFRTPLTLIQVSLEKLHDKLTTLKANNPGLSLSSLSMPLATLDKNARRMSRLIDELLTFRKVEKGKMVLYPEPTEVIGFLREIFDNFNDEALSKRLKYTFNSNLESFEMNVDRNALEKIANNLISNALKYTREGGDVTFSVNVDQAGKQLILQVIDNGVGIPEEKRELLFSRFMQSAMSRNSIGVGLHLTFGLVDLHQGKIVHSDNAGGGSVFTVTLPTDLKASEHKHEEGIGRPSFDMIFREDTITDDNDKDLAEKTKNLLIIDDDADIRNFLSQEFSRYFMILMASDGQTGLEVARNNDVHIIICDVMMPDMSGYEVTRLLKEDFATSHIPIIQLTALSNDDCQLEGITSGADAYITKPFNLKYLMTRVAKLIEQRENLFAKYSANPTLALPELPMGDKDKEFADKLAQIAEKNIDNSEYSVDDFASDMALGRTIFFRKVKGVTGYSPKEYLRVMRMKKAAELLLTTDLTITEITYKVGISDPAYFNKCFKAQFGKAPSVYQKENTTQPNS